MGRASDFWNCSERLPFDWQANTIRHFVPQMIEQKEPGIVVSTASLMGIVTGSGVYGLTKQ